MFQNKDKTSIKFRIMLCKREMNRSRKLHLLMEESGKMKRIKVTQVIKIHKKFLSKLNQNLLKKLWITIKVKKVKIIKHIKHTRHYPRLRVLMNSKWIKSSKLRSNSWLVLPFSKRNKKVDSNLLIQLIQSKIFKSK